MNALYDAPDEADGAAPQLDEFELGLLPEDDAPEAAPSPWMARACVAGALVAHLALVGVVVASGLGWHDTGRPADFAEIVDVEIEARTPRPPSERVHVEPKTPPVERVELEPKAPPPLDVTERPPDERLADVEDALDDDLSEAPPRLDLAAPLPSEDIGLSPASPPAAGELPIEDRLALSTALEALAAEGAGETIETLAPARELAGREMAARELAAISARGIVGGVSPPEAAGQVSMRSLSLAGAPPLEVAPARPQPLGPIAPLATAPLVANVPDAVEGPAISQVIDGSGVAQTLNGQQPAVRLIEDEAVSETVIARTEEEIEQGSVEDPIPKKAALAEAEAKKAAAAAARKERAAAARRKAEAARKQAAEKRRAEARKAEQAEAARLAPQRRYIAMVKSRVAARKPSMRGPATVSVSFAIAPNGSFRYVQLARRSGRFFLDQAVLMAVRRAGPFPPPPAGMTPGQLAFTIPFTFR